MTVSRINEIIQRLRSAEKQVRQVALKELEAVAETELSPEEGIAVLREAAEPFLHRLRDWEDTSATLISKLWGHAHPQFLSAIADKYGGYSAEARTAALALVAELTEREAAETFLDLIQSYGWPPKVYPRVVHGFAAKPRHADVLFPTLVLASIGTNGEFHAWSLCYDHYYAGLLTANDMESLGQPLLDAYAKLAVQLVPAQRVSGIGWRWEEPYFDSRGKAGLLLDLLGYADGQLGRNELTQALEYRDPRLKCFAILSLLRRGQEVPQDQVDEVASSHEMRRPLYEGMEELGRLDLFPDVQRSEEAFAYSDMVNWLCFPTELDREPDDIELMEVASVESGDEDGILNYYIFRFRTLEPHWAAESGWTAGVSGPFIRAESPSPDSPTDTFSSFEPWDSKSPEEHLGDVQNFVSELLKRRNQP